MGLEAWLGADFAEGVLHGDAVGAEHTLRVNVDDVDVVERPGVVCSRDDLAGFVEGDLWERAVAVWGVGFLAADEFAGEDHCGGLNIYQ
jgi:hypothetical protein